MTKYYRCADPIRNQSESDRIRSDFGTKFSASDRIGLDAEYQIQSKVTQLFMTKLKIRTGQFVIFIIYCVIRIQISKLQSLQA